MWITNRVWYASNDDARRPWFGRLLWLGFLRGAWRQPLFLRESAGIQGPRMSSMQEGCKSQEPCNSSKGMIGISASVSAAPKWREGQHDESSTHLRRVRTRVRTSSLLTPTMPTPPKVQSRAAASSRSSEQQDEARGQWRGRKGGALDCGGGG